MRVKRLAAVAGAFVALAGAGTAQAQGMPSFGATTVGDRLFPGLGNGGYDVQHYAFHLHFGTIGGRAATNDPVYGTEAVYATATKDLSGFTIDYAGTAAGGFTLDGAPVQAVRYGSKLVVVPAAPIRRGRTFVFGLGLAYQPDENEGDPLGTGWHPLFSAGSTLAVAAQPDFAHHLFAFNDHPSDKASFSFRLDVPASQNAVANGLLTGKQPHGDRIDWTYLQRQPMAPELLQLAVGDYDIIDRGIHNGIQVRDVIEQDERFGYPPMLAAELTHLDWLEARLGSYPFDAYGSFVSAERLGFSLETQTLSIFSQRVFWNPWAFEGTTPPQAYEPVMVHELAHQWFGDSVSPATWSDVWLSEGHATWYELLYEAEHEGWLNWYSLPSTIDGVMELFYSASNALRATYGPPAQPKTGGGTFGVFNQNVYRGGALVLYALRQEVGADTFQAIERAWVSRQAGKSASSADFAAVASDVAGRDLRWFLAAWLYSPTVPPMPGHPDWVADPAGSAAAERAAARAAPVRPELAKR